MTAVLAKVQGHQYKKRTLSVERATAVQDPYVVAQTQRQRDTSRSKRARTEPDSVSCGTPAERTNDKCAPLWRMPYPEQLLFKHKEFSGSVPYNITIDNNPMDKNPKY